jgi:KaiC/GvpD/RAD55 family RecA-like ATPase
VTEHLTNTIYNYPHYINELGWDLVPLPPKADQRSKVPPLERDWAEKAIAHEYGEADFLKIATNTGCLTGSPHNLTDADCDDPLTLSIMPVVLQRLDLLKDVAAISGRASKPQSHFFYYTNEGLAYYAIEDPISKDDHPMVIEYRCRTKAGGRGHQTMIPPSIHPSGEPVEWELPPTPDNIPVVSAQNLLKAIKWTGAITLMAKYFPTRDRHHAIRAWAKLLRDGKFSLDDAQFILALVGKHSCNPTDDTNRHVEEVYDSPEGTHLHGWPHLERAANYDSKVLKKVADVLELNYKRADATASAAKTDVDGYITLLQSQPLESFPMEPMAYIIDGVVPKGHFTLVTGSPGSGKSTVALDWAFEVAAMGTWVVYLDRENPREIVQARFADRGSKTPERLIYHGNWNKTPTGDLLEPPKPADDLYAQLIGKLGNPVLIFDTLSAFSDADENDNTAMTKMLRQFKRLCYVGATVILLHHCGKDPNSFYRGAEAIKAVPDVAWKLHPTIQEGQLIRVKLENFKTRTGSGKPIEYLMNDGRLVRETKGIHDILLDLLHNEPEMSSDEFIKQATTRYNFVRSTVRDFIASALRSGDVVDVLDEKDKRMHRLRVKLKTVKTVGATTAGGRLPF